MQNHAATAPRGFFAARSWSQWTSLLGVIAIHVATVVAIARGVTWQLLALAAATYWIRMFAITGAYHRYFSHRTYKTSRAFQFFLGLLGVMSTQKGPLWWGATHRHHHKHSDDELDPHSPARKGFLMAHMGWWLAREWENTDEAAIADFAKYPELRFLDRFHLVGPALLMLLCWLIAGSDGILWGYVVSTCVLLHCTFTINSLAHVFGSRRYATTDTSRNNVWLALLTMGEGWHNNHHHYMSSTRQGFFWWEIDATYYVLWLLSKVGLVWDLRGVPESALKRNLIADVGERCELLVPKPSAEPVAPPLPVSLADAE
ncbi:MAG: acyl-CoA desaturase [Polyangiaceae bacterium]